MPARTFICYAKEDRAVADRLCAALEAAGLACWIAPRDIPSGQSYAGAIVAAIRAAEHFVLLFSERANHSRHVENEVERAFSQRLAIHPLRLDATPLSPELEYFLSRPQWFDAFGGPLEPQLDRFVAGFLRSATNEASARPVAEAAPATEAIAPDRKALDTPRAAAPERRGSTSGGAIDRPSPIVPENIRIVLSLTGAGGGVNCVACSPDGTLVASGCEGGLLSDHPTLHLWHVGSGKLLRTFETQTTAVATVALSPDGSILASGDQFGTTLWDTATGARLRKLDATFVNALAFSPDGRLLASGSLAAPDKQEAGLDVWRVESGRRLHRLPGHTDHVFSVAFSSSGAMLASGSLDKTARLWDVGDGRLARTLPGPSRPVRCVIFLPDGESLLLAGDTGLVTWDPHRGACEAFADTREAGSVACSPCGTIVAAGCSDEKIRFFRLSDRTLLKTVDGPTRFFSTNPCHDVAFLADGNTLVSAWGDKQIRLLALT